MTKDIRLGTNRGLPRLWLEGKTLSDCGFVRFAPYNVILTNVQITFVLSPEGKRKVSGKTKADGSQHPIIDMNGANLAPFANVDLVLTTAPGQITITRK